MPMQELDSQRGEGAYFRGNTVIGCCFILIVGYAEHGTYRCVYDSLCIVVNHT